MSSKKVKGISRIDSKNTHGWFVRKYRDGQTHSKFFSDSRYHGREAAFEAAKTYKIKLDEKYPPPKTKAFRVRPQKNSKTGVVGVSETYLRSSSGKKIPCFIVSWQPEPNRTKTKKFSIPALGRDEAFRQAVAFRKEKEAEMLRTRG